jgi:uncharacterized membrane protein
MTEKSFALRLNRLILRLSRNWLRVALAIIALYISLPWLAPTFMRLGLTDAGRLIYTVYRPFCHQFGFRSFFLYGEQPVYPRHNVGLPLKPFEEYVADLPEFAPDRVHPLGGRIGDIYAFTPGFQFAASDYVGNPQMGYKMTLCERDITIYTALFLGGVIYGRPQIRRRLRPVPIWLYVLLGILPIGLDGFSQMFGYPPFNLWPPRETLPAFRVLTGALFGLMNAWLAFPYLDLSFQDTRRQIETKLRRAGLPV